jgi:hypothetical protein
MLPLPSTQNSVYSLEANSSSFVNHKRHSVCLPNLYQKLSSSQGDVYTSTPFQNSKNLFANSSNKLGWQGLDLAQNQSSRNCNLRRETSLLDTPINSSNSWYFIYLIKIDLYQLISNILHFLVMQQFMTTFLKKLMKLN